MKKSDQGIFSKWLDSLGVRHAWIFGIAGLFIYKIIDMNTIQWFGETIFITNNSSILGFLVCAVLFWSAICYGHHLSVFSTRLPQTESFHCL